jgi:hypothetical protein
MSEPLTRTPLSLLVRYGASRLGASRPEEDPQICP